MSKDPVIRAAEAEVADSPPHLIRLLADGSDTAGAFSIIRVDLRPGCDGAAPHSHQGFPEVLYVIEGDVEILSGDRISTARAGDLAVVPPGMVHAFGALGSGPVSLLAVISTGIDRLPLAAVANGEIPYLPAGVPARYDSRLVENAAWRRARAP